MAALLLLAFAGVPFLASDYMFSAILIPFVIMAMAALGVNNRPALLINTQSMRL